MVGEIRDLETADIAIKAAQTGHMVMSTLHTNDAPDHADAPAEHGRGAVQHRLQRDPDHGAAPGARCARTASSRPTTRARPCCKAGYKRGRPGRQLEALPRGRLLGLQQRLQGPGGHLPGDADHRGSSASSSAEGTAMDIAAAGQREGVRDLRQSGLVKVRRA
jgi:type IV pilus assembly protein PilB